MALFLLNIDIVAIQAVKDHIDNNLSVHYTLPELSQYAGLNRNKLSVGFHIVFGVTLKAYVSRRRLELAKQQLLETELPLKQISKTAGYRYKSNFCTAFKKAFGVSPVALRSRY